MDDPQDLASLSFNDLEATRETVISERIDIQARFKSLTLEMLVRRIADLTPDARFLDLDLNPNYDNGSFWEFNNVLDANGNALFADDEGQVDEEEPAWQALQDLFNDEFSADYTDCLGPFVGSYFDLATREALDDLPLLAASL